MVTLRALPPRLAQMHPLGAGLFHVRDGKVTKFVGYLDHERALEAVGLRE